MSPEHPNAMSKIINSILHQQNKAIGDERTFEIYNDKYLKVSGRNLLGETKYHLNLSMMEPWPVRHRMVAWRWLLGVVYFAIGSVAFIAYSVNHAELNLIGRVMPFIVLFVLLTLACLVMFLFRSPNVLEFRSRYGGIPLINLLYNKPEREQFKAFVEEVKTRILGASQQLRIDKKQMLAIELREIRRLVDEGALQEQDYSRAKARIMSMHV